MNKEAIKKAYEECLAYDPDMFKKNHFVKLMQQITLSIIGQQQAKLVEKKQIPGYLEEEEFIKQFPVCKLTFLRDLTRLCTSLVDACCIKEGRYIYISPEKFFAYIRDNRKLAPRVFGKAKRLNFLNLEELKTCKS